MRKTVLEMYFLNDHNACVDSSVPRFVYRRCSTLAPFKIKRLTAKLKVGLVKLFVGTFAYLLSDYFHTGEIRIANKVNQKDISIYQCYFVKGSLYKTMQQSKEITETPSSQCDMERLALKFEIKMIKQKVMFALYYPEDFSSEIITSDILNQYEKLLREILKAYSLP